MLGLGQGMTTWRHQPITLSQQFSTGVLQEFLKHAMPTYLVRALTYFPLDCHIKNDNGQHNSSRLV